MRGHAEAMGVEDLIQIMEWSRSICPESRSDTPRAIPYPDTDEAYAFVTKHVFMRAFISTAFTLWTRYVRLLLFQK